MSYYNNYYVYYGGTSVTNKRIQVADINHRSASSSDLSTLGDPTQNGVSIIGNKREAKSLELSGSVTYSSNNQDADTLLFLSRSLKGVFSQKDTFLRLVPKSATHLLWTSDGNTTGVTTGSDSLSQFPDTSVFQNDNSSLQIIMDVSLSANHFGTITFSSISSFNLFEYDGLDLPFVLSDSINFSRIDLYLGQSAAAYKVYEASTQSMNQIFVNGGNVASFDFNNSTATVGAPTNTITWAQLVFHHSINAQDYVINLGAGYAFKDRFTENYSGVYPQGDITFDYTESLQEITSPWSVSLLCPQEYSSTTFLAEEFSNTVTTTQTVQSFGYSGSKDPLPTTTLAMNSGVSNVSGFTLTSQNTLQALSVTGQTFVNGDQITVDYEKKSVAKNGLPIRYTGQMRNFWVKGVNYAQLDIVQSSGLTTIDFASRTTTSSLVNLKGSVFAQSFVAPVTGIVNYASMFFRVVTASTGGIRRTPTLSIQTNSGASPSNVSLSTVNSAYVLNPGSGDVYQSYGNLNASVTSGVTYWLVATADCLVNGNVIYGLGETVSFASGQAKAYSPSSLTWLSMSVADLNHFINIQPTPAHNITWALSNRELNY